MVFYPYLPLLLNCKEGNTTFCPLMADGCFCKTAGAMLEMPPTNVFYQSLQTNIAHNLVKLKKLVVSASFSKFNITVK